VSDELQAVLRLVAEGRLTPEEAAPIIDALTRPAAGAGGREGASVQLGTSADSPTARNARQLRIRVSEHGRQVVNLRIPLAFADMALRMVPGIGEDQSHRIRAAVDAGALGPILDVEDEEGGGVLITLE
jgi:hypothetical protein